jgi:hypothetical protein
LNDGNQGSCRDYISFLLVHLPLFLGARLAALTGGIQSIGQQEVSDEIEECLWQGPDLPEGKPNLLEANRRILRPFWDLRTWPFLLEDEPPYS